MRGVLVLLFAFCTWVSATSYSVTDSKKNEHGFTLSLGLAQGDNRYGKDIEKLQLDIYFQTDDRLRFVFSDPAVKRWRVPSFTIIDKTTGASTSDQAKYSVKWNVTPFSLQVTRKSDQQLLFDSTGSELIFEDQFLEISTKVPLGSAIYGLGEQISTMKLGYRTYSIWTQDTGTPENKNLYGAHPFYMELRNTSAHGVFFHNSNAMDVLYQRGSGADSITYRSIGGILDFYVFVGTKPEEVVRQYTKLVGTPYMPPYWSLGFHQCRWGYHDLKEVEGVVEGYRKADIPLETMWTDIDYMQDYRDFTFDSVRFPATEMKKFVDRLHSAGQHYMLIVDPGISNTSGYAAYDEGSKLDIWVKNASGKPFVGSVWPGSVRFPDWLHPATTNWWQKQVASHHAMAQFDGMWIDMNEIINFCNGDCANQTPIPPNNDKFQFNANRPPYAISNGGNDKAPLFRMTLTMDSKHYNGELQYNVHNLHGYMEARASTLAMEKIRGERALVISRSTYSGSGHHGGHWTGDNESTWRALLTSVADVLNFNMYGIPMVGADICGFAGTTTEELCSRWIQLGVFYPFSRNHNSINMPSQELYRWASVAALGRKYINLRYTLLPLYYTLFYEANSGRGGTVLRPLWFEFPDSTTASIDQQFMLGSSLLVTPVLQQGAVTVRGYFPHGRWYDLQNLTRFDKSGWQTISAPLDTIHAHIRGGSVLARQGSAYTLNEARTKPFNLVVAPDDSGAASGTLFLDDGKSLSTDGAQLYAQFKARYSGSSGVLATSFQLNSYRPASSVPLTRVYLLGVSAKPTRMTLNGLMITEYQFDPAGFVIVTLHGVAINSPFILRWA